MGIYLNPGNKSFQMSLNSKIYVDKSGLIAYTNSVINTAQRFVCVSRPRRFGKSVTAEMLAAYYGRGIDSSGQFQALSIAEDPTYPEHLNRYNVIFLNMQKFFDRTQDVSEMKSLAESYLIREILRAYPDINYFNTEDLTGCLTDIFAETNIPFVFIIDEWDCIFREYKKDTGSQRLYLDFIRNLLKDQPSFRSQCNAYAQL